MENEVEEPFFIIEPPKMYRTHGGFSTSFWLIVNQKVRNALIKSGVLKYTDFEEL